MNSRNATEIEERRFARQIRTTLDASARQLPPDIAERLAAARRIAVAHRRAEAPQTAPRMALASHGAFPASSDGETRRPRFDWMRRLGLVWTLIALGAGLTGIYHWQQQQRIEELADIDAAMLLDDLPPSAYADQGFHVFLKHGE